MKRGQLIASPYGALSIWEHPVEGYQYAMGVDTSSGIKESVKEGDPSAASVIEIRSCRQVAEMHGYMDPTMWGYAVARLAGLYNDAKTAIETQPSQHGLAAFIAAERYGCPGLYMQARREEIAGKIVERRGWVRPQGSTADLFNRIREAMKDGCPIRSPGLLDELAAMRYEEGKFKTEEHDDRIIAHGLALLVRDQVYARGEVKVQIVKPEDISEVYWNRELEEDRPGVPAVPVYEEEWNGL